MQSSLLLLLPLLLSAPRPAEPAVNVIVVLVDDLGWTDLSCQGSAYFETPNIDRLAGEGMRFTDAYAACAVCSPTRAAVLTGRYPARVGVTDWIRSRFQRGDRGTPEQNPTEYVGGRSQRLLCPPNPFWMERDEVTLAEALKAAGYATGHIGKWHLGDDAWYPDRQGFDENHGGCDYGQPPSYFDPYRNKRLEQGIPTLAPRREGEYLTDREGDEASDFIRRHRDEPFFLYLAHYAVHTPIQGKRSLVERYQRKEKTNQKDARYAAMVHSVDDAMGRVLDTLRETGLEERTLILFTSDNGGLLGPTDNAPLRSGKGYPYEGGIRVPFLVRWPGQVPEGAVSAEPVCSVDVLPTVLDAAGVAPPAGVELDGRSLLGHLRSGGQESLGREDLFWHFPHYRNRFTPPYSIVRSGDWKLIRHHEGPRYELFHLGEDLGESVDRSARDPERVKQLDRKLTEHLRVAGAKLPGENPDYLPRLLILGDSISIGYTEPVRELLAGRMEVLRPLNKQGNPENCAGTTNGVTEINSWLRRYAPADVIHFNFGLHDLKRVKADSGKNSNDTSDPRQAELVQYEQNLRVIVERLRKTGARLIFATTTPVPEGGVRPHRDVEDPQRYNDVARRIMKENGIAVNDLYALALEHQDEIQKKVDVHFSREGSELLARGVVDAVRKN